MKKKVKKLLNKHDFLKQLMRDQMTTKFWQKTINRTNFLKFIQLQSLTNAKKNFGNFTIRRKIFINKTTIARELTYFLHSSIKLKNTGKLTQLRLLDSKKFFNKKLGVTSHVTTTILYNAHKSLIWKMRMARYAHWKINMRGTLNEWRYDKLLANSLSTYHQLFQKQLLCVIFANLYCCFLSWKSYNWFFDLNIVLLNGCVLNKYSTLMQGDILELPYGPGLRLFTKYTKSRYLRRVYRVKRFLYKLTKKKRAIKSTKKKYCFKQMQNLPVGLQSLGRLIAVDPSSKVIGILGKLPFLTHNIPLNSTVSAVLTLQNWRFRFD